MSTLAVTNSADPAVGDALILALRDPAPVPPPGELRLAAAQILGWLGMLVGAGLVLGIMLLLTYLPWNWNPLNHLPYPWADRVLYTLLAVGGSGAAGAAQARVLRGWIAKRRIWLLVSTAAGALILLGAALLLGKVNPSIPVNYLSMSPALSGQVDGHITRLAAWMGATVGLPAGLLLGLAQSGWLTGGRRRWWWACGIGWAPVLALLSYLMMSMNLILQQMLRMQPL